MRCRACCCSFTVVLLAVVLHILPASAYAARRNNETINDSSWTAHRTPSSASKESKYASVQSYLFSWYYYMMSTWAAIMSPPVKAIEDIGEEIQQDMATAEAQMEEVSERVQHELQEAEIQARHQMEYIQNEVTSFHNDVNLELRRASRRLDKGIRQYIFQQRVGLDLFLHSILNHIGLALGGSVTLSGYQSPKLARGAVAIQAGKLTWKGLAVFSRISYQKHGLIAVIVGSVVWRFHPRVISDRMPPIYLAVALFNIVFGILDKEASEEADNALSNLPSVFTRQQEKDLGDPFIAGKALLATGISLFGLRFAKIPVPLVAASLAGADLVYNSIAAEISGNWVRMITRIYSIASWALLPIVRPVLRLLKRKAYRESVRNLFGWEVVEETRSVVRQVLSKVGSKLWSTWRTVRASHRAIQTKFQELPGVKPYLKFASRIEKIWKRHRQDILPLAIAATGIARQMGWVNSFGDVCRVFNTVLNPGTMLSKMVKKYTKLNFKTVRASVSRIVTFLARGSMERKSSTNKTAS
jgi:hypothetical protein